MKKLIILMIFLSFSFFTSEINTKANSMSTHSEQIDKQKFKELQINHSNGVYEVMGKAKVRKGVFYYTVENGHEVVVSEKRVKLNNLNWVTFKLRLSIPSNQIPQNGVLMLNLYEKDKSGKMMNELPVVLDSFKK